MLLKLGSKGQEVIELQQALEITVDGDFGPNTQKAVMAFQQEHGLMVDGIVGSQTLNLIHSLNASTDLSEKTYNPAPNLNINKYFLPADQYLHGPTQKEFLFLHHTAGWHNPYKTVDDWANDSRGTIATEFVLGGQSIKGDNHHYDGELVQCLPEGAYAWHLGKNGSQHMHTHSIGIEICNFGYIENGKTYAGTQVDESQIVTLDSAFRGYTQWHAYSDAQLETLKAFILWIAERDSIDVRSGLIADIRQNGLNAFEYNDDAFHGRIKGMWSHSNTRRDKTDLSPQPNLVDMLMDI